MNINDKLLTTKWVPIYCVVTRIVAKWFIVQIRLARLTQETRSNLNDKTYHCWLWSKQMPIAHSHWHDHGLKMPHPQSVRKFSQLLEGFEDGDSLGWADGDSEGLSLGCTTKEPRWARRIILIVQQKQNTIYHGTRTFGRHCWRLRWRRFGGLYIKWNI